MGRRPHALIQEFFDRGPKLADSSNRYQHTCKRCGEIFPKGRIDSLTTHLLRRCSNLSPPDRTWVFQQLQTTLDKPNKSAKRSHAQANGDLAVSGEVEYQSELPPPMTHQQPSALETLAEVSGQHSSRRATRSTEAPSAHRPGSAANTVAEAIAEQALLAQLQALNEIPGTLSTTTQPAAENVPRPNTSPPGRQGLQPNIEFDSVSLAMSASSLVQAASAANQQLDHAQSGQRFIQSDFVPPNGPTFESFNIPIDMGFRMSEPAPAPDLSWTQPTAHSPVTSFGNFSMPQNNPMVGYGMLSSSTKQKPRGRFDDVRRKEVGEIRKQGACIRCRMLKKPCSGETPCKTCATVESARIWKGKCLRTRLSEEMTLWSANFFGSKAQAKLSGLQNGSKRAGTPGVVYVSLSGNTEPLSLPTEITDHNTVGNEPQSELAKQQSHVWLPDTGEKLDAKLGAYVRQDVDRSIETQPHVMQDILRRVQKLSQEAALTEGSKDQHELQRNVVELWALTELLTSEDSLQFRLSAPDGATDPSHIPTTPPTRAFPLNPECYSVIQAQLLAAMESRCSKLSKSVLNELERRLLQRQQTSRFATLLAALVLLSSVERITAYHSTRPSADERTRQPSSETASGAPDPRDDGVSPELPNETPGTAGPIPDPSKAARLCSQGAHLADLLTTLLRMRALPPKTRITPNGTLSCLRDFAMPPPPSQASEALPKKRPDEESKEAAADWLDGLELEAAPLQERRDADGEGGMEAWSLKFVAGVLLPEKGGR